MTIVRSLWLTAKFQVLFSVNFNKTLKAWALWHIFRAMCTRHLVRQALKQCNKCQHTTHLKQYPRAWLTFCKATVSSGSQQRICEHGMLGSGVAYPRVPLQHGSWPKSTVRYIPRAAAFTLNQTICQQPIIVHLPCQCWSALIGIGC